MIRTINVRLGQLTSQKADHVTTQYHSDLRQGPAELTRQCLIDATLEVIGDSGLSGATVREITKRANVTQGLVRHYFSSKDMLINAAYAYHMSQMTEMSLNPRIPANATAVYRLAATVRASLTHPVLSEQNLTLWASFLGMLRKEDIRKTHEITYLQFRDGIASLIGKALEEAQLDADPQLCRQFSISSNAVIDGLWIEGAAMQMTFDDDEIVSLGLQAIGAVIGLDLASALDVDDA